MIHEPGNVNKGKQLDRQAHTFNVSLLFQVFDLTSFYSFTRNYLYCMICLQSETLVWLLILKVGDLD